MDQLQNEFLIEIEQFVQDIFADLDQLGASCDRSSRRDLIDQLFRHVHSVKGSAATCGLKAVSELANEFEGALNAIRAGYVALDENVLEVCESATEALAESLNLAASGVVEPSRQSLFQRLQALAANSQRDEIDESMLERLPAALRQSLTEEEQRRLRQSVSAGNSVFEISVSFAVDKVDQEFPRLKASLNETGEVISSWPSMAEHSPDAIHFNLLFAGNVDEKVFARSGIAINKILDTEPAVPAPINALGNFVRTDLDELDRLISNTHELLRKTSHALSSQPASEAGLRQLDEEIRGQFRALEDQLIKLRLVSIGPTLQRVVRAGKSAARAAGKEVHFEVAGSDIQLDKFIVEAMADPLMHLVRNAVDHGIETAAERARLGKASVGIVRIEAVTDGAQTRLRVLDDGTGIDPELIKEAATRLKLPNAADLDLEKSLRLIFRPGFTTLVTASTVSGRGVGLDIVETAVEQLGGELRVSTERNRGTTFEIRLPVTFGLLHANVIVSAGQRYCIPVSQTLGIDAIDLVDGTSAANRLPQASLRDLLGQPEAADETADRLHLVTCQYAEKRASVSDQELKRVGIVVDSVEGPEEVLVRSLGRHSGRWYGIAGATELRDGSVALVLDLPRLLA